MFSDSEPTPPYSSWEFSKNQPIRDKKSGSSECGRHSRSEIGTRSSSPISREPLDLPPLRPRDDSKEVHIGKREQRMTRKVVSNIGKREQRITGKVVPIVQDAPNNV